MKEVLNEILEIITLANSSNYSIVQPSIYSIAFTNKRGNIPKRMEDLNNLTHYNAVLLIYTLATPDCNGLTKRKLKKSVGV